MRVLFTSLAGYGHFHPLVPVARALEQAGHEVAFAVAESFRDTVTRTGFRHFPAGLEPVAASMTGLARERMRQALAEGASQAAAHSQHIARMFVERSAARMVEDLPGIIDQWRPTLLVRDLMEMGACIVAEQRGLPCASVQVGALRPRDFRSEAVARALDALRATRGLPPDAGQDMLYRSLHLCFAPPSYLGDAPLTSTTHYLAPALFDRSGEEELPAWAERLGADLPVVYASLGTVFNKMQSPLRALLEALREEPVELVMTVGRDQDPAEFGPQPSHVHVERYIPQTLLFPRCAAAFLHAGYNSVTSALSHGLPLVLVPLLADQPLNAERCQALGVARVLELVTLAPRQLRDAVREVLTEPSYREAARRFQREARELPGLERAVGLLEQLERTGVA